ncbi:MAG: hypothetical protein ACK4WC_12835 [Rubrimonas sp.]
MARETDRICPLDPPCADCWCEGAGELREWLADRLWAPAQPVAAPQPDGRTQARPPAR